jgi:hypothetical protein
MIVAATAAIIATTGAFSGSNKMFWGGMIVWTVSKRFLT